jgi:hypothetical protein
MHNQNESGEWRPSSAEDVNAIGSNEFMPSSQFETHWRQGPSFAQGDIVSSGILP